MMTSEFILSLIFLINKKKHNDLKKFIKFVAEDLGSLPARTREGTRLRLTHSSAFDCGCPTRGQSYGLGIS